MRLKTSFFNKALIKSDFKRFWWIPALHTLALFLTGVFPYIQRYYEYNDMKFTKDAELIYTSLYGAMTPFFILSFMVPVFLAVFLFSYLQKGNAATFAHSIPVSRGTSFVSHAISGIAMYIIPLFINGIVLLTMRADAGFAQTFYISHLFMCLGISALYSTIAFSLATAVAMITGNVVANLIFTYVFALLPYAVELCIQFFADTQLFGYVLPTSFWCAEHLYLAGKNLLTAGGITLYLVLSAVFLTAAFLLYKIRNLENHNEVVAFPTLRPVFVFGVTICSGVVGFAYSYALFRTTNLLVMLPFGLIGLVIAMMIVKKSFRHLGLLKPSLLYILLVVCVFSVFRFDLTRFESRIPAAQTIEHVTFHQAGINNNHNPEWYYDSYGKQFQYDQSFSPDLKTPEEIDAVLKLHKHLITQQMHQNEFGDPWDITLSYQLKNGKTLERRYAVDYAEYQAFLEPIITTDTIRKTYFPILRDDTRFYKKVSVNDRRTASGTLRSFEDQAIIEEFLVALKRDTQNAPYSEYAGRHSTFTSIEFTYTTAAFYKDGSPVLEEELRTAHETYYIRPSYKNTLAILEKYALLKHLPTASDIAKIGVEYYGAIPDTHTKFVTIDNVAFPYVIENQDEISEVYAYCENKGNTRSIDMHLVFFLTDGRSFHCELNSRAKDFPSCLNVFVTP